MFSDWMPLVLVAASLELGSNSDQVGEARLSLLMNNVTELVKCLNGMESDSSAAPMQALGDFVQFDT